MVGHDTKSLMRGALLVWSAALVLGACGSSGADIEQTLWDDIRNEIPAAAKPDCPADAALDDGSSFTCEIQITEVLVDPANPGKIKQAYREVDVTVVGDQLQWEIGK